tara:strand:+ start:3505 stop:4089 length:585 start_codon:yes stop_codon:yes gene_type:complete
MSDLGYAQRNFYCKYQRVLGIISLGELSGAICSSMSEKIINYTKPQGQSYNLANYFGIHTEGTKIIVDKIDANCLRFTYYESQKKHKAIKNFVERNEFINPSYLPPEINKKICEFIETEHFIEASFVMTICDIYPFVRPRITLENLNTNIKFNFQDEFEKIVNSHNIKEWHMSMLIEKDILDFILDIRKLTYLS